MGKMPPGLGPLASDFRGGFLVAAKAEEPVGFGLWDGRTYLPTRVGFFHVPTRPGTAGRRNARDSRKKNTTCLGNGGISSEIQIVQWAGDTLARTVTCFIWKSTSLTLNRTASMIRNPLP
jgi:hypothetical protein